MTNATDEVLESYWCISSALPLLHKPQRHIISLMVIGSLANSPHAYLQIAVYLDSPK